MIIYPAIDILNGQVVRLTQGDYNHATIYHENPAEAARSFQAQGATHLHMVDLDGAKDNALSNYHIIAQIASDTNLFTQVGGGIRDLSRIKAYVDSGISRVIIGTAAIENPEFLLQALELYGDVIAVGVDAKNGFAATHGWMQESQIPAVDFCKRLRDMGVKTVIYTDIAKDGMLSGPNHGVYETLSDIHDLQIIASGGVSSITDIQKLSQLHLHGAIVGKALYSGTLSLSDTLLAAGGIV